MPVEDEALAPRAEDLAEERLALHDVAGVFVERDLVDVEVRVRVIAELRAGVEPLVKNAPQPLGARPDLAARVDEADHRDLLLAERREQTRGHRANRRQRPRPGIAPSGKIVD